MVPSKSLEYIEVFNRLLCDVQMLHSNVFTTSDLKKTLNRVHNRFSYEGLGLLTKTLPRLGKALDQALSLAKPFCSTSHGFKALRGSQLPQFLGELFSQVLHKDGTPLPNANVACVQSLRDLLFVFYKLEIPCDPKLELNVINKFIKTEDEIKTISDSFTLMAQDLSERSLSVLGRLPLLRPEIERSLSVSGDYPTWFKQTVSIARRKLQKLFAGFDPLDVWPKHGPGAVSTKEQLWGKYNWSNLPKRITDIYPADRYYYASMGHVCDAYQEINSLRADESAAKVILVPKDSRGPRLISCEPLEFQWIQQGLSRAIVSHVESHFLTRGNVRFTDQEPNRNAALIGSATGKYATLDLNEASDRVSLGLVHLLFPDPVKTALLATRSLGTRLPSGEYLKLHKFAPMGSALCFPILALTVWSLLSAGFEALHADVGSDAYIYVYGDDVIVPTAYAAHAMSILSSFGLKINQDKSCTKGFFRESCGMDAFKGVPVIPVRIRTAWTHSRRPESYISWLSYARSFWDKKYYGCYDYIVGQLGSLYGSIPTDDFGLPKPISLPYVPHQQVVCAKTNHDLQKREYYVLVIQPVKVKKTINGWSMLLRFFTEANSGYEASRHSSEAETASGGDYSLPFCVRVYTKRRAIKLVRRWR